MIRDGDVFVAALARGRGHFFERRAAVGLGGVHVQIAADLRKLHQLRQAVLGGGFDLAPIFAQLRRNPGEARALRRSLPRSRRRRASPSSTLREPVFVERQAHLQRALAQRHVVFLAAGEILQRRAVAFRAAARAGPLAMPSWPNLMLALFSPLPSTSCTLGCATNFSSAPAAPGPVTSRSRSPTVSRPRRRLPAGVIFRSPDVLRDIRSARPRRPARSSAENVRRAGDSRRWSAELFLPAWRPCAAGRAVSARGTAAPDRRWWRSGSARTAARMLFGPRPWIFRSSSAPAGYFSSISSRRSKLPRCSISASTRRCLCRCRECR